MRVRLCGPARAPETYCVALTLTIQGHTRQVSFPPAAQASFLPLAGQWRIITDMSHPAALAHHPIIAFVTVRAPERAKAFYRDTLGLPMIGEELPYALVFDANGIMLRLAIDPQCTPSRSTVLGWRVTAIEDEVRQLTAAGVVFELYEFLAQDGLGVWTTPTDAKVAWFKDPDGNLLSLSQHP